MTGFDSDALAGETGVAGSNDDLSPKLYLAGVHANVPVAIPSVKRPINTRLANLLLFTLSSPHQVWLPSPPTHLHRGDLAPAFSSGPIRHFSHRLRRWGT